MWLSVSNQRSRWKFVLSCLTSLLLPVLAHAQQVNLRESNTDTMASLRGVAVAGKNEAWVTGSAGSVMRTSDSGRTWQRIDVPGSAELDFRDVEIPATDSVLLMAAGPGSASQVLRSSDAGKTWKVVLQNTNPQGFFDGMDFDASGRHGLLYGDPIQGRLDLYVTHDGGETWRPTGLSGRPVLSEGEYGFAASGTGVTIVGEMAYVATGGSQARVWRSADWGQSWQVAETPVRSGNESSGIFSIAFRDSKNGLVVGGDYTQPERSERNIARSGDGGKTWEPLPAVMLEHKACLRSLGKSAYVACGRTGVAVSWDGGQTWNNVTGGGYYTVAVDSNSRVAYLAGSEGRVAVLQW